MTPTTPPAAPMPTDEVLATLRELQAGDEVLVTKLDHDGNVAPWLALQEDLGIVVRDIAASLAGHVRVNNNSGEDYENAQVRLVVGIIRLVEDIAQLARLGRPGGLPPPATPTAVQMPAMMQKAGRAFEGAIAHATEKPREIVKEGLSEYFLYTVEGRDTIPTGWSKRLPSFRAADVPIVSYYKFERERWGDRVIRYYRFKNDKDSKLGTEPLPDGDVKAFRTVTADNLCAFVGRTNVKYIPIGEQVEIVGGLMEGETIVTSGNFLLDSESRMKAAAAGVYGETSEDPVCGMEVDQTKAISPKAGDVGVLNEVLALLFALVAFFPVPPNSQHVLGSAINGDHVRKGDAVLVFKSRQVIVNVNLKELETVVIS